ncbi:MAG TPA: PQQ-binding-like beta-propeller repeat protein, partial [Verrucomicrobiae bacterium]
GSEVPLKDRAARIYLSGGSMFVFSTSDSGQRLVTRVNPATGEFKAEEAVPRPSPDLSAAAVAAKSAPGASPSLDLGQAATKISGFGPFAAAQAVALQSQVRNEKILAMIKEDERGAAAPSSGFDFTRSSLIAAGRNVVEFSTKLIEEKTERRQAMKAPPKRSALDGPINQAATAAIANEILNEMQRERTEGVEVVDVSRYQVTLKRLPPDDAPEWTGEVIGRAQFFSLKTVDLLVAGTTLLVFDKSNKKLWESKLTYPIAGGFGFTDEAGDEEETPSAPGVERDGALYFFDQGVLTAFDLATGNVRWRMPSVGVSRLYFDGRGAIYVSTTSASAERLKYSQQIDVSQKTASLIQKVEAKSGKTLWKVEGRGSVAYVSGKFIYAVVSSPGVDGLVGMGAVVPHIRIFRLAAGSGRTLWEHHQTRYPLDVAFDQNKIELLFDKELQVLKFISP